MNEGDKELVRLRTRIKEEFMIVRNLRNADIESAMINVDNLIEHLLKQHHKCERCTCSMELVLLCTNEGCANHWRK
jgi:hypothetical protein